jgi:modification methylase
MPTKPRRKSTSTSSFGAPGRISHDSSAFYAGKMYETLPQNSAAVQTENSVPCDALDHIFCKSSEAMTELPDNSIHLMVTSPPYNVGKDYDQDFSLEEYLALLRRVWAETMRVLAPGGRACINIANLGRKPYIPLHSYIVHDWLALGALMRGEIIWNKSASSGGSTAWGSWSSAANPTLRDVHEYILVFSKGDFARKRPPERQNTISKDEFLELTKSIWTFPTESARKVGHPAPFPVELPYRLIQLYTFTEDVVLDPFMGAGSTALAALRAGRHFVGYDLSEEYVRLAEKRIREACIDKQQHDLDL